MHQSTNDQRMTSDVVNFISLLEKRESWTVDKEPQLYSQCLAIAELILKDPAKASLVPFELWLVFLASLPYGVSIITLARLDKAIGNATTLLVAPRKSKGHVSEARTIMIHRCNTVIRNTMQKMMFLGKEQLIAQIAAEIQD
jgi:hypothetical protein